MAETEKYNRIYRRPEQAKAEDQVTFAEIWRSAWGDERPYEIAPTNFITWAELRRIPRELHVGPGSTLADVGCGSGGPGLWVAQQTGARVIGIDLSPAGCDAARKRAATQFGGAPAEYHVADMNSTGLPAATVDAAISIDAVQIAPDRLAVFREIGRILRPAGRFVVISWDHPGPMPPGALLPGRELVPDSRPLLEMAGLRVLAYDVIPSWPDRAVATYRGILEHRETVAALAGEAIVQEAEWGVAHAHHSLHVFIVGEVSA